MPPVPPRPDDIDADNVTPPPPTDAAPAPTPATPAAAPKYLKPSARSVVVMVVVALLGIALILRAWHLWPFTSSVMVTDNAYVRGQITVMAPQVNGYVTEVLVKDFQHVREGEPLLRIDDRIYTQRVAQAQATLDSARAALANSDQSQAQNRAQIASAHATLSAGQAELQRSRNELKRYEELAAQQLVSVNDRDKFRTTQASAQASVQQSQAQIRIAEETLVSTQVARKSLEAQVESAQAQLELARIDLANTVIHAPRDGQISEASVRVGQYVAAGSQLLFLVPDTLWVVANYKEGQTWGAWRSVSRPRSRWTRSRARCCAAACRRSHPPQVRSSACCARTTPAATSPRWCSGCRCGYRSMKVRRWPHSCGPACR